MDHGATEIDDGQLRESILSRVRRGAPIGRSGCVNDETHVVSGTDLPELGVTILAHQRQSGIEQAVSVSCRSACG